MLGGVWGHHESIQWVQRLDTEREDSEVDSACSCKRSALLPKVDQAPLCMRSLQGEK